MTTTPTQNTNPLDEKATYRSISAPPLQDGLEACIEWVKQVEPLLFAEASTLEPDDPIRLLLLDETFDKLRRLKNPALAYLGGLRIRQTIEKYGIKLLTFLAPLNEPTAGLPWAFLKLVQIAYEQCCHPLDPSNLMKWKLTHRAVGRAERLNRESVQEMFDDIKREEKERKRTADYLQKLKG